MTHHTTQPDISDVTANRINRLREIRRTARHLGYILNFPQQYNNYDIDHAASELSSIIYEYNQHDLELEHYEG